MVAPSRRGKARGGHGSRVEDLKEMMCNWMINGTGARNLYIVKVGVDTFG